MQQETPNASGEQQPPKKRLRYYSKKYPWTTWAVFNLGPLTLLLAGRYFDIPAISLAGEIIYWFVSILAVVIYVVFKALQFVANDLDVILSDKSSSELIKLRRQMRIEDRMQLKSNIFLSKELFTSVAHRKIPYAFDLAYDIAVLVVLSYMGYAWLTIFYAIHILAIYNIIEISKEILRMPSREIEDVLETNNEGESHDFPTESPTT